MLFFWEKIDIRCATVVREAAQKHVLVSILAEVSLRIFVRPPSSFVISYIMLTGLLKSASGKPKNKYSVMLPYFIGSKYKFKVSKSCSGTSN